MKKIPGFASLLLILFLGAIWNPINAKAEIDCNGCHGTRSPSDYRPIDAPFRNITSGGFQGSHRTHLSPTTDRIVCVKCHPGCDQFTPSHRNGVIQMSDNIHTSTLIAVYRNGSTAITQSPAPKLGSCNNVNCHFENKTDIWGSTVLTLPDGCSGCHGVPPGGGAGGAAGSHAQHDRYYQGLDGCPRCHTDHRRDPAPFMHATGAGRNLTVTIHNPYSSASGNYSGPVDDYLPKSQTNVFGSCYNVYCHSTGSNSSSFVPNIVPVWGTPLPSDCSGCHGNNYDSAREIASGSHAKHAGSDSSGRYGYDCSTCHFATASSSRAIADLGKHANGRVEVRLAPPFGSMSAYKGGAYPGSSYSTCTSTYCHSNGTSIVTGTIPPSVTTNWGGVSLGCNTCHGNPPSYGNGMPKANSHVRHGGFSCDHCHYGTTTSGAAIASTVLHVNRAYDVSAGNGVTFSYSYAASGGSCSSINCHNGGSATWGTTLACDACHDCPPSTASHLKHYSGTVSQAGYGDVRITRDFSPVATGYIMNCGNCHPMDRTRHGNGVTDVELYNVLAPTSSLKGMNPATASYAIGTTSHTDSRGYTYTNGNCSNVYCHSYNSFATPTDCTFTNESGSRFCDNYALTNLQVSRVYRSATWNAKLPDDCSGCHANAPRTDYTFNDGMTGDSHSWGNPLDYEQGHFNKEWFTMNPITCNYCHNDTVTTDSKWWRTDPPYYTNFSSVPITGFANHVNGHKDVTFEKSKPFTMERADWWGNVTRTNFNLYSAAYNKETRSCNSVSCHLGQKTVTWGKPYRGYKVWYGTDYGCWECHSNGY